MTNEPIINAKFKKFREIWGLSDISDGEAFERFVNSSILRQHQPDAFSADSELLEKICVGGTADTGIDGLAIKVNGLLVKNEDEVTDLINKFKRISIEFIFIQSKYKPNFDASELGTFISGVRNFLLNEPTIPMNEKLKELLSLKEYLLSDDVVFSWADNPSIRMYYVAMGKWRSIPHHMALAEQAKSDIKALKTYEKIDVHFTDSEAFRTILDNNENNFTAIIETIVSMELTPVDGVENSCISLCKAEEFYKLLITDEGVIRKSLFDDNVRDYQGENTVNTEIYQTIQEEPSKFILLNNGITIVCDEFISNNRKLKIVNPQIVNGCQTSHVIFEAKQKGISIKNVPLNVKIIATKDDELSNEIVRGTNRQNIVMDEAFEATKKFHKDLEIFFNDSANDFPDKLYYERRSKQYAHKPSIKQVQKINLRVLTQFFVGMFLNKPHFSHRHESFLLKEFSNIIFQETQSKYPYFAASYAFFKMEQLFREEGYAPDLKAYKAHILMMFRESVGGQLPSINNEKNIIEYSKKVLSLLKDDYNTRKRFDEIAILFRICIDIWVKQRKKSFYRMKDISDFTSLILEETQKKYSLKSSSKINEDTFTFKGDVMRTMHDRFGNYCGFIRRHPNNIFFHSQQNKNLNFSGLEGRFVMYKVQTNPKNNQEIAVDIEIVKQ